jgi:uncharacterized protein (TIGR00297 family)
MPAGAAGSGLLAVQAYRMRALTRSGAWAAGLCAAVLFVGGSWTWVVLVGVFFITASALTRLEPRAEGSHRSLDRMGRRWDQVAANGGVAAVAAVVHGFTASPVAFAVAAGAIAAATADTWGTEIGRWSPVPPRLITSWATVPHGSSGGITLIGTLGAAAGALLIGVCAVFLERGLANPARLALVVSIAGFSGALVDSLLGATIEDRWRWAGNNAINLVATSWGAGAVLLASWWLR